MKEIKSNHYTDTIIYSIDMIIRNFKNDFKQRIDNLNIGITSEQFVVLDTIYAHENLYQEKLSDILMKDKSNTTRIIKILENNGLIKRKAGQANNRLVYILCITNKGKKLVDANMPKIKNFIAEIFKNITGEEIDVLHTISNKIQKVSFN